MILVNLSVQLSVESLLGMSGMSSALVMMDLPEIEIVRYTDNHLFESCRGTQSFENFCLIWIFG
jgi:hypothetical protein